MYDTGDKYGNYRVQIIADSFCNTRLTTFVITYPRMILAEINTHCMLSKSTVSSRAVPLSKKIEQVMENPFIPVSFGKNKPGMQAISSLDEDNNMKAREAWLKARDRAVEQAYELKDLEVHKQWANRLLEPFMWSTTVISGTDWYNFFILRMSDQAQPEFDFLAGLMVKAYIGNSIYIVDRKVPIRELSLNTGIKDIITSDNAHLPFVQGTEAEDLPIVDQFNVSAARCARVSYNKHDGTTNIEDDLKLADMLLKQGHMSPFQHQAITLPKSYLGEYSAQYNGWLMYRKLIERDQIKPRYYGLVEWEERQIQRGFLDTKGLLG